MTFVEVERPEPEQDLGPEWGIFDARGMLAASYRVRRNIVNTWVYNRHDAGIERFLILDSEDRARLFCEAVAESRGRSCISLPPDLDQMIKNLTQS